MHTQPSSLESESRRDILAREPKIYDILLVRMSEIDEGVINCEIDNDIELFFLLWKLESWFCVELEVLCFKLGVH